jgi:hypothetical protein
MQPFVVTNAYPDRTTKETHMTIRTWHVLRSALYVSTKRVNQLAFLTLASRRTSHLP